MNVESIRLINFRNYTDSIIELNENTNIFVGKNAQGKTNLLEAIYICATGKSFRTNKDRELINFNKKAAYIGAKVKVNDKEKLIEIKIDLNGQKRIKLNKIELKSQRELDSGISVVIFSPEDLKIVKDGPVERRNFLDMSISQIRPVYKHNLSKYNKILLQRNNLLKSGKSLHEIENLLDIFDMQLVKTGTDIITTRLDFVKKLSDVAFHIHSSLTKGQEKISIEYNSAVSFEDWDKKSIEKEFIEQIYSNRQKDLLLGATSIGPHRDDMSFMINGKDARIYASQGQQRTIVLTIKLAEVEILKIDKGVYPVLLLDDVFSELDLDRRRYLVKAFNNSQTVITTTEVVDLDQLCSEKKSIFYIENGKIKMKG